MNRELFIELEKLKNDLIFIINKFDLKKPKIVIKVISHKESIILNSESKDFYQIKLSLEDLKKWNSGLVTYDDLSFSRRLLIKQSKDGFSILLVRLLRARGREKIYEYIFDEHNMSGSFNQKSKSWICPHQGYLIERNCIDFNKNIFLVLHMDGGLIWIMVNVSWEIVL